MQVHTVGTRQFWATGLEVAERTKFLNCSLFVNWVNCLDSRIRLERVKIVSVDYKPNGDAIFAKLSVTAFDDNRIGKQIIPDVIFLRGNSVAIFPILISKETGQKYVVFTEQVRLPFGGQLVEIPAGMMDQEKNFIGVAAKEFKEEIGIAITAEDLTALTANRPFHQPPLMFPRGIAVSPGVCDEMMQFYLFRKTLPQADIEVLQGALTGNQNEGESICLKIVPWEDVPSATCDGKFFTAYALMHLQGLI
ncbi:MAG: NUDIX domain-containing protein [Candidatus Pacebacteria bacterium]|nr:NUDIX domain-containing protein [Candidatus Paceibacterota bacterium]